MRRRRGDVGTVRWHTAGRAHVQHGGAGGGGGPLPCPALDRIDLDDVLGLVQDKKYFVLHAPRQTGKTSALLALRDLLNPAYSCWG